MGGFEITDRNEQRAKLTEGGWTIIYGDLINEFDVLVFVGLTWATGGPTAWVQQEVANQLKKFSQSLQDVSEEVVASATHVLQDAVKHNFKGEWDFNGLGVKAGFVTYHRWWQIKIFSKKIKNKLPNNHQPYISIRVTKPLPPRGAAAHTLHFVGGETPVPTPTPSRSPSPAGRGGHHSPTTRTVERLE